MLCIKIQSIKIVSIITLLLSLLSSNLFAEIYFNFIVPFRYNYTFSDVKMTESYISLVSLKNRDYYEVGVQSKNKLSSGIGGEIRIPFSADVNVKGDYIIYSPIHVNDRKYNYNYIKSLFDSRVIPYIKLTMNVYYFFNDFVSLIHRIQYGKGNGY